MGFKMRAPYVVDNTAIYHKDEPEGILGRAHKNGNITIDIDVDPNDKQYGIVLTHEKTHKDQFEDFEKTGGKQGLSYTAETVTWNGEVYPRKNGKIKYNGKWMIEGHPNFPWEKEAYNNEK